VRPALSAASRNRRLTQLAFSRPFANAQLGLIAGGLVDGTVNLWNPSKIVGVAGGDEPSDGADGALVASLQKHTGAVCAPCPCAQQRALRQP
jgi:protein transport protein SEC31